MLLWLWRRLAATDHILPLSPGTSICRRCNPKKKKSRIRALGSIIDMGAGGCVTIST